MESIAAEPVEAHVTQIMTSDRSSLARSVRNSFDKAFVGTGELDPGVLEMRGMSGRKYRLFINHLIRTIDNARYLEIGSWSGSTLCSVLNGNAVQATAIDNWSEFGGPRAQFWSNVERFKSSAAKLTVIETDFRQVNYAEIGRFNVYMFDGPHTVADHYDAITLAEPALEEEFVLIVDDWNQVAPRTGTMNALQDLGLSVYYSVELRTSLDGSHPAWAHQASDWHNGYFIAVVAKRTREITTPATGIVTELPHQLQRVTEPRIRQTPIEESAPLEGGGELRIGPHLKHLDTSRHQPPEFVPAKRTLPVDFFLAENVVLNGHSGALYRNGIPFAEAFFDTPQRHLPVDFREIIRHPEDVTMILGSNLWCQNYFHWLTQCIPSMYWALKRCEDDAVLMLLPKLDLWQEQILSLAGMSDLGRHTIGRQYYEFPRLAYTTLLRGPMRGFSRAPIEVFRSMRSRVSIDGAANSVIYVSRIDADNRVMRNESELCALLEAEGIDIVIPNRLSVEEQIRRFANAKAVIGPHGAGLANIVFCEPGATLYELLPDRYTVACYATLAQSVGMNYWAEAFPNCTDDQTAAGPFPWVWSVELQEVLDTARELIEMPTFELTD